MKGTVQKVELSKSGKSYRVQVSGTWLGAKLDSKLDQAVGKNIDYTVRSDPKFGDWVESYDFDRQAAETQKVGDAVKVPQSNDRYWLNFVSNCVGQGIAAKTITEPGQINAWATAAYKSITTVGKWTPQNPEDDSGPDF